MGDDISMLPMEQRDLQTKVNILPMRDTASKPKEASKNNAPASKPKEASKNNSLKPKASKEPFKSKKIQAVAPNMAKKIKVVDLTSGELKQQTEESSEDDSSDDSDDSDSSEEETSSSEEESMSDFDFDEFRERLHKIMAVDAAEQEKKVKAENGIPRKKVLAKPIIIEEDISKCDIEQAGVVHTVVDNVISFGPNANIKNTDILNYESAICLGDKTKLGRLRDIIGLVEQPLYTVVVDIENLRIEKGMTIYWVPSLSKKLLESDIDRSKPSDLTPEDAEGFYSDDEAEKAAKDAKKKAMAGKTKQERSWPPTIPKKRPLPSRTDRPAKRTRLNPGNAQKRRSANANRGRGRGRRRRYEPRMPQPCMPQLLINPRKTNPPQRSTPSFFGPPKPTPAPKPAASKSKRANSEFYQAPEPAKPSTTTKSFPTPSKQMPARNKVTVNGHLPPPGLMPPHPYGHQNSPQYHYPHQMMPPHFPPHGYGRGYYQPPQQVQNYANAPLYPPMPPQPQQPTQQSKPLFSKPAEPFWKK